VDPTAARHGVLRGQVDLSALVIRGLEKTRLATDVRWPKPDRVAAKLKDPALARRVRGYVPTSVGASPSARTEMM
jgi:stearoyl-CoA desaturase (delta-9 desaturase)